MIPQLILLVLGLFALGAHLSDHGKPKTGRENFFISLVVTLLLHALLYWGGWYDQILGRLLK